MLGAILEEPPFVDDTSGLGARAGGGANVLQRHEELVSTPSLYAPATFSPFRDRATGFAGLASQVAAFV